jgi:hypothetical protein
MLQKIVLFLLTFNCMLLAAPVNRCEWYYLKDENMHLKPAEAKFDSAESAATVKMMEDKLKSFLKPIPEDPLLQALYESLTTEIQKALDDLQSLKTSGYPQSQLSGLVERYNSLLIFPYRFIDWIASATDSGMDIPVGWSLETVKELQSRLDGSHTVNLYKNIPLFADSYKKTIARDGVDQTSKGYLIEGHYSEKTETLKFIFQYKYVFKTGLVTLLELIKDRESGKVDIGVSPEIRQDYDGQHGHAKLFTNHDYFHAFFLKYKDHLLFRSLGITTFKQALQWKTQSHGLLQRVLDEWANLPDKSLKASIEILLFVLMHEQGASYPTQVLDDLTSEAKKTLYHQSLAKNLKSDASLDPDISVLMKGREEALLNEGIKWILSRAQADSTKMMAQLPAILKP